MKKLHPSFIVGTIALIAFFIFIVVKMFNTASESWQTNYLEDKFGDKTNIKYIINRTTGSFSNSAVASGALGVHIYFVEGPIAGFSLHKNSYDSAPSTMDGSGTVDLKNMNNETIQLRTFKFSPVIGIMVEDSYYYELVDFLQNSSGEIKGV